MTKTVVYKYKKGVLIDTIYPEHKPTPKKKTVNKEVKGAAKRKSEKNLTLQEEDSSSPEETTPSPE